MDEEAVATAALGAPLTHALVIVRCKGKTLFVHDTWKDEWELPGGSMEPGETARQCAVRELAEETGQHVDDLEFKGLMKFRLKPDDRIEYGALYSANLAHLSRFQPNKEIDRIVLWDLVSDIGPTAEIDIRLVEYA